MTRGAGRKDRATGTFGSVDKLVTGYRARYFGPGRAPLQIAHTVPHQGGGPRLAPLRQSEIIRKASGSTGTNEAKPRPKLTSRTTRTMDGPNAT